MNRQVDIDGCDLLVTLYVCNSTLPISFADRCLYLTERWTVSDICLAPGAAVMDSHGHLETQFHLLKASTILLALAGENH